MISMFHFVPGVPRVKMGHLVAAPPPLLPTAETPKKATKLGLHFFAGFSNKQLINSDLYRCKP